MNSDNQNFINKLYDKEFREKLIQNPDHVKELFGDNNLSYSVVESTQNKMYIVVPYHGDSLSLDQIGDVNAASTASSVSSVGSGGTICTTFSTAGTVGTAGSAS